MIPTIYLSAKHYSSNLIRDMRNSFWKPAPYMHLYGLFTCDLVVPFITAHTMSFLEYLSELQGIDVLMGTREQSVKLYLTSQDEASVEIPYSSPIEVQCTSGKGMATKIRRTKRATFDF